MECRTARTVRIALAIGSAAVVLLVAALLVIPANRFRLTIEQRASAALGRDVSVGRLRISLVHQSLSAETLTIADDPAFSSSPFLAAKSVTIGVRLWPLIVSRSLNVTNIRIEQPVVRLSRNAGGRWNYASLASSSNGSGTFAIRKLELRDGRVLVGTGTQERTYDHVNVAAFDLSPVSRWPITATAVLPGGGAFSLSGAVGPMDRTDKTVTPLEAMVAIEGLNLAKTGFLNASAGGVLDVKATIASAGHQERFRQCGIAHNRGYTAGGAPASRPFAVTFDSSYDLRTHLGTLKSSALKMGAAAARLTGTYDARGEAAVVNIKVAGGRMSAAELEAFMPALGIHLPQGAHLAAGTIEANLNVAGAMSRLVAAGQVGLFKARLTGFDLGSKMRAISAFTGLHTGSDLNIEAMTTNMRVAADGLRFDHFTADVASLGHITGTGTIDARNNLHFGMVATLAHLTLPSPLSGRGPESGTGAVGTAIGTAGALGGLLGTLTGGGSRIPFLVEGTTSNPQFIPDLSGVALHMLQGQLGGLALPR